MKIPCFLRYIRTEIPFEKFISIVNLISSFENIILYYYSLFQR